MASITLEVANFNIHFPSGFILKLCLPREIKIYQFNELIRSYACLHKMHGTKDEEEASRPTFMSTISENYILDCFLSRPATQKYTLQNVECVDFKIQYAAVLKNMNHFHPAHGYKISGRVKEKNSSFSSYIVRNRTNCMLYKLLHLSKQKLDFNTLSLLLRNRDYFKKCQSDGLTIFPQCVQAFQTVHHLNVVLQLYPIELATLKIESKCVMDLILNQIAQIIHVIFRDGLEASKLKVQNFKVDFQGRVVYEDVLIEMVRHRMEGEMLIVHGDESDNKYSSALLKVVGVIFKNTALQIVQLYAPLHYWLKNGKISKYSDYLRYVKSSYGRPEQEGTKVVRDLLNSCRMEQLMPLLPEEAEQFIKPYTPLTDYFKYTSPSASQSPKKSRNKTADHSKLEQLENTSTVKKVKRISQPKQITALKDKLQRNQKANKTKKGKHRRIISSFLTDF